jgi:MFS transporter, DHA1 family, multidrug resistance protein
MSPGLIVLVLSLLLGLQPIATDLYLPALPALTSGFGAPMSQAQLTLTALLLCFGLSQLVWGPLSDRHGRRPVLLVGMSAFVAASIGSTFAPSMEQLIVWRAVQGAAMGAGVMCARAIVRDLYAPSEGARVMSKGLTGLGVIACAASPTGGLLSDLFGWRVSLMALATGRRSRATPRSGPSRCCPPRPTAACSPFSRPRPSCSSACSACPPRPMAW